MNSEDAFVWIVALVAVVSIVVMVLAAPLPTENLAGDAKSCGPVTRIVEEKNGNVCVYYDKGTGFACRPQCMPLECVANAEKPCN